MADRSGAWVPAGRAIAPILLWQACAMSSAAPALAGGFAINEQTASAAGTATAGAGAVAEDAGTVFYNPAGMALLDGDQLLAAGQLFLLDYEFDNGGTIDATGAPVPGSDDIINHVIGLPTLFAVLDVSERVKLGLGLTAPFGLRTEYEDDWVGRYNTLLSGLSTLDINPSVSLRVTDWLSVGGGVSAQYANGARRAVLDLGSICVTQLLGSAACAALGIAPQGADGSLQLEAGDWSFGYNLGLLVQPAPGTRIGVTYRSQVHHSLTGDGDFTVPAIAAPLTFGGALFQDTDVEVDLTLPASMTVSLYQELTPRLAFLGDVTWTGWHSFDTLRIEFTNPLQADIVQDEDWTDVFRYSAGLRYQATDALVLRAGAAYDETPVEEPLRNPGIPGSDRIVLAVGAGYRLTERLSVDLAYVHAREMEAEVNDFQPGSGTVKGTYDNRIHIISGQLSWKF